MANEKTRDEIVTERLLEAQRKAEEESNKASDESREAWEALPAPPTPPPTMAVPMIFGDTPTDPTIGDVVVPAANEEGATASTAEVDELAAEGDEDASDLSPEEAKRQADYGLDEGELTAAEKVRRIEEADSPEEVDELASDDDRVTVRRAAEKKRSSWS